MIMLWSFIFVQCELAKAYEVAAAIADTFERFGEEYGAFEEQVFSVSGEHDLLIKARFLAPDNLGRFVNEKLHQVPHIRGTKTIIAFNAFAPRQKVQPPAE
jgi:DNA-binding Lrp family transcriptional regulator